MLSLLREPTVIARLGVCRMTLWAWVKEGRFPAPVRIGARAVAWRSDEVEAWMEALPRAADTERA